MPFLWNEAFRDYKGMFFWKPSTTETPRKKMKPLLSGRRSTSKDASFAGQGVVYETMQLAHVQETWLCIVSFRCVLIYFCFFFQGFGEGLITLKQHDVVFFTFLIWSQSCSSIVC